MDTMDHKLSVLVIEPYYGGSHKAFLEGLQARLPFEFTLMAYPPRKWQWRMRMAAPMYAALIKDMAREFDVILCSTFIDVAALRALAPPWVREAPILIYFHENQFAYPVRNKKSFDIQFGLINMTSAMAADAVAFNSNYNLQSFLSGINEAMKHSSDMSMESIATDIEAKACVLSPAIDFSPIDKVIDSSSNDKMIDGHDYKEVPSSPPLILWNHRWEHDKGPEEFFEALYELADRGVEFELAVLGEQFRQYPPVFDAARQRLGARIIQFGYARDHAQYVYWLARADVVVSTSIHEFFGISVMEAVRAGCRAVLPRRLSYPELFSTEYLYDEGELPGAIERALKAGALSVQKGRELTEPHSLDTLAGGFKSWIENAKTGKQKA
jgi:glycosyltransferase involved in cell wall biosynthesis